MKQKSLKKPPGKRGWYTRFERNLKGYEEELIQKLPNEFRDCFHDYNPRSSTDNLFLIDENKYNHF